MQQLSKTSVSWVPSAAALVSITAVENAVFLPTAVAICGAPFQAINPAAQTLSQRVAVEPFPVLAAVSQRYTH